MFLLTTGARRGEALASTWNEFTNRDIDPIVWTKPSAHTKQRKTYHVALNSVAASVIRQMYANRNG
jgi:integrase